MSGPGKHPHGDTAALQRMHLRAAMTSGELQPAACPACTHARVCNTSEPHDRVQWFTCDRCEHVWAVRVLDARGFTLLEILIVITLIGIIAAIGIPGLLNARMGSNESSAIATLRAIHSAQALYQSICGAGGYARSLDDLGRTPPAPATSFVGSDLATNGIQRSGYKVTLSPGLAAADVAPAAATCNSAAAATVSEYFAEVHPVTPGWTGRRSFAITHKGAIYQKQDGTAIAANLSGATVLQ